MADSTTPWRWTAKVGYSQENIIIITIPTTLYLYPFIGKVYAFGRAEYGRLGLGEEVQDPVKEPTLVSGLSEKTCVSVNCGTCVSFVVTDEGDGATLNSCVCCYVKQFLINR